MSDKETVGDTYSTNRTHFVDQSNFATQRFEYLVEKRDTLQGRIRFGALTLNGASLIGLTALIGDKSTAMTLLGIDASVAKTSAALFILGAILAAASIFWVGLTANGEVASAFTRMRKAQWLKATFDGELNESNEARMNQAMQEFHKEEITDFEYSNVALGLQNGAAACWLVGMIYPLLFALGWAHNPSKEQPLPPPAAAEQPQQRPMPNPPRQLASPQEPPAKR